MILCKVVQSNSNYIFHTAQQSICVNLETSSLNFPNYYFNFFFSFPPSSFFPVALEAVFLFLSRVTPPICVFGPHYNFSGVLSNFPFLNIQPNLLN